MNNQVLHTKATRKEPRMVFFSGSTAVTRGHAVCYDRDFGTAADLDPSRDHWVQVPSVSNNNAFAGVAASDYPAVSGGQWIEIYEPGSICQIYVTGAVTIGETAFVTFLSGLSTNAGQFHTGAGFMGKGTARVLQTRTDAGLILAELMEGQESGGYEIVPTATLTAGGAIVPQVGGYTFFDGAATPASDVTFTLANGTFVGQKRGFTLDGALTTNDVLVTVTTGTQLDGSTALATLEFDADNDTSILMWTGERWLLEANIGTAMA